MANEYCVMCGGYHPLVTNGCPKTVTNTTNTFPTNQPTEPSAREWLLKSPEARAISTKPSDDYVAFTRNDVVELLEAYASYKLKSIAADKCVHPWPYPYRFGEHIFCGKCGDKLELVGDGREAAIERKAQ